MSAVGNEGTLAVVEGPVYEDAKCEDIPVHHDAEEGKPYSGADDPAAANQGPDISTNASLAMQMALTVHTKAQQCNDIAHSTKKLDSVVAQVRNWVKRGDGEIYVEVLDSLESLMSDKADFVLNLTDTARLLRDYELQASMLMKRIQDLYDGSNMDKWNAKNFERELSIMDEMYANLPKHEEALKSLTLQKQNIPKLSSVVWKLDRHLRTSDNNEQIAEALQRWEADQQTLKSVLQKQGNAEAEINISKARVSNLDSLLQEQERCVKTLTIEKEQMEKRLAKLKEAKDINFEDQMAEMKKLSEDTEKRRRELLKQKESALLQQDKKFEQLSSKLNGFLRQLEDKLMVAKTDDEVNHIIFLLDTSASMSCRSRWTNTVAAVESFLSVRVQQGSHDKVSIICFNHQASVLCTNMDIGFDFIDELRKKASPGGGTAYAPAWAKVQQCAENGPPGSRLFVVQVTDGESGDINAAASHAKALYHLQAKNKRTMLTLFVNIDCTVDEHVLEPLVKAANGGRVAYDVRGRPVQLFSGIHSAEMVSQFKLLATLPLSEADELKSKISHVREMERQERERLRQSLDGINEMFDVKLKNAETMSRALAQVVKDDVANVARNDIVEAERERAEAELNSVKMMLDNAQQRVLTTKAERSIESARVEALEKAKGKSEESSEDVTNHLADLGKQHAAELKGLVDFRKEHLDNHGTVDGTFVYKQVEQLQQVLVLHNQYRMLLQHAAGAISSLQRFTKHFTASIREPLADVKDSLASKAEFTFQLLFEDRALLFYAKKGEQLSSTNNLCTYLKHESLAMGLKQDEVDDVVDNIIRSNIQAEDLCSACGAPEDQVEVAKRTVLAKLEQHILETSGISGKKISDKKLKELREQLKNKQKEVISLQAKKLKTTDEDELDKLEDEIDKAEDERDDLHETIQDAEQFTKDTQDAMAGARYSVKLVERAFAQCLMTYVRQCEKERLRQIQFIFGDLYRSAVLPIRNFRKFTEGQQESLNDMAGPSSSGYPHGSSSGNPAMASLSAGDGDSSS